MITVKRIAEINIKITTKAQAELLQAMCVFSREHIAKAQYKDDRIALLGSGPEITIYIPSLSNFINDLEVAITRNKDDMGTLTQP